MKTINLPEPTQKKLLFRQFWQGQLIEVIQEGPYRSLRFDNRLVQSRMLEEEPDQLVLQYTQHMVTSLLFLPEPPQRILMIGLGAGSLVRFFLRHYGQCQIHVIENNEAIPPVAREYFHLPLEDPRLTVTMADGAEYIATAKPIPGGYDLILVDAFDHRGMSESVYSNLFFKAAKALMADTGVMAINMTRGETAFFEHSVELLRRCFTYGLLRLSVYKTNNEVIIACRQPKAWGDWSRPKVLAGELSQRFGITLDLFLEQMVPTGQGFWGRWRESGK